MSRRRTRTPAHDTPAPPADQKTVNSIPWAELRVGMEIESPKFAGVARVTKVATMEDRVDDNDDKIAVLYLKRAVGRMAMDPP